jgi:hypothetical protein
MKLRRMQKPSTCSFNIVDGTTFADHHSRLDSVSDDDPERTVTSIKVQQLLGSSTCHCRSRQRAPASHLSVQQGPP